MGVFIGPTSLKKTDFSYTSNQQLSITPQEPLSNPGWEYGWFDHVQEFCVQFQVLWIHVFNFDTLSGKHSSVSGSHNDSF